MGEPQEREPDATLRVTAERRRAEEWALVLTSQGIPCAILSVPEGFALRTEASDAARGRDALDAFESENRAVPVWEPPPEPGAGTSVGLFVAAGLVLFFLFTGAREPEVVWFQIGSAAGARIRAGELWRLVTALTLHADLPHVALNALACAVFVTAVCRGLGRGAGLWLVLLSGVLGNALNVLAQGARHDSAGASTAIFGAVGILASLAFVRRRRRGAARRWQDFAPLAAGLALLGMLGTAPETDVWAHFFGFVSGVALGGLAALRAAADVRRPWQDWALVASAAAAVAGAWCLALR